MIPRAILAPVTMASIVVVSACTIGGGTETTPEPSPSLEPAEQVLEFTGLTVPESATDLIVDTETTDDGRERVTGAFTTDRVGSEEFCTADNLGVYADPEGPTDEDRETFDADEETVDGATTCQGAYAGSSAVQREVLVLYPEDDQAAVYFLAYETK